MSDTDAPKKDETVEAPKAVDTSTDHEVANESGEVVEPVSEKEADESNEPQNPANEAVEGVQDEGVK